MLTKTKIAICVAVVTCGATAGFAKDQNVRRNGIESGADSNGRHSFGQTQIVRSNSRRHGTTTTSPPISRTESWQNLRSEENTGPDR